MPGTPPDRQNQAEPRVVRVSDRRDMRTIGGKVPMPGYLQTFAVGVTLILLPACGELAAPEAPDEGHSRSDALELPPPDTSLDPERLAVGELIATPCVQWGDPFAEVRGRDEWAFVDVYFGRMTADGQWDGPTDDDVALVREHGGTVLYRFNVPAVRARMILSRLPDLVMDGLWITVRDVPDPARQDVPLTVGFTRALTDSDIVRFERLGGRIDYRWDSINAISGPLPDRSIPDLRSRPEVDYIQAVGVSCLQ